MALTYDSLCETFTDDELPRLDRSDAVPSNDIEASWIHYGFALCRKLIPEQLIDSYVTSVLANPKAVEGPIGFVRHPQMRAIVTCKQIREVIDGLFGETMACNLTLSNWKSSERQWHQDDYLNPGFIKCHYVAAWIALEDIDPDSGRFEFVPKSHKWPVMRNERF